MEESNQKIIPRVIEDEMKSSYLGYSMSVIVGRALPDVRDGLKPIHRRILYTMLQVGLLSNKPFKKSANVVGTCMARFHPHGDAAIYDALVRMVQDFSLRYPLVQGQGNWGSIDGDASAAMRYTECRLNKLSEEMLQDIDKETVGFTPNFDGSLKEPVFLPAKAPNLLINGSSGIAVGMATNIPPHNLNETCDGVIKLIDNSNVSDEELMQIVSGPDFPTGGIIYGKSGIREAYKTGKGKIILRAKAKLEEYRGKTRIIVTEIPYQVNKSQLIEDIANLVRDKKVHGIGDLRDESDREGIRIVIELKSGANSDVVLNQLFTHTRLQTTFGVINLALVDKEPKILSLGSLLHHYLKHRKEIVRRRTEFDLKQAQEKSHLLKGIILALDNIDPIIKLVRESKSADQARKGLIESFNLSEKQAQAVLDIRLQRLTSMEQDKVREENKKLLGLIEELKSILASEQKILDIIRNELNALKEAYGDGRRTQILETEAKKIEQEQLIKSEEMVLTITNAGYVKRIPVNTYKQQRRGGKGVIGTGTRERDFVEDLFVANTHDHILFFTNLGKVHWLKVYQIPEAGRQAKGTAIINLLSLDKNERATAAIPVREFNPNLNLLMVTKNGIVKKTSLEEFSNPRKGGIAAITLEQGNNLIAVALTDGTKELIIATRDGMAVKFHEKDTRPIGRTAKGVIGIRLKQEDYVIGAVVAEENKTLLTITELGYGKRSQVSDYRLISRGGVGVTNVKITEKNGKVVAIKSVQNENELLLITQNGIILRVPVNQISIVGRHTQGVRIIKLDSGDKVVSTAIVRESE